MKKQLTIVRAQSAPTPAVPPRVLGKSGQQLWASVTGEYSIDDAGGIEMLLSACQALDRAESCRAQIDKDGEVVFSKGVAREHSLLKAELSNRSFVVRTLARLGLNFEPVRAVGRPPGGGGWKG